jgi:small redox-active disulfide protein 2
MNIKVLGTGCPTCKQLFKNVEEAVKELNIDVELEKIEDIRIIMSYGIMSVPALIINDQVKFYGKCPSKEEIKKYLV